MKISTHLFNVSPVRLVGVKSSALSFDDPGLNFRPTSAKLTEYFLDFFPHLIPFMPYGFVIQILFITTDSLYTRT
jgi:hypothetical protein